MAGFAFEVDPTSEDATNVALNLSDGAVSNGVGFRTLEPVSMPDPPVKAIYASSFYTEGGIPASEHQYENREITLRVRIVGSSDADLLTKLGYLAKKQAKINREGGTLKVTFPSTTTVVYDLVQASGAPDVTNAFGARRRADVEWHLIARPFGRGAEVSYTAKTESTLPALIDVYAGPAGDVSALGRLTVTESQAVDQLWMAYGLQSRYYDSASTAALFYEAEALTPKATAAIATVTGASGGGSNNAITEGTLTTEWTAMLSTQILSGSAHMTHVGQYRIFARVQMPTTNTGQVSVRFDWAVGDFRRVTENNDDGVTFDTNHDREGQWLLLDLGLVDLKKIPSGSHRWEGRVVAKSTVVGDDLSVDWLVLFPIDVYGELTAATPAATSTAYVARDPFDAHTGGANLVSKVAPVGGTWAGGGDTDDFTTSAPGGGISNLVIRDDLGDTAPRVDWLPTSMTNTVVQVDAAPGSYGTLGGGAGNEGPDYVGVAARITNATNYLAFALVNRNTGGRTLAVIRTIGGTITVLRSLDMTGKLPLLGQYMTFRLMVDTSGRWWAYWGTAGTTLQLIMSGQDVNLATGGTLASGFGGMIDYMSQSPGGGLIRRYENLAAFAPSADAVVFASRLLEVGPSYAIRQDSGGSFYNPVSKVSGNYLRIPPAGREARPTRLVVKLSRGGPGLIDGGIDDAKVQLFVTPRYLSAPG